MKKIFNFQFSIFNFISHPLFSGSLIMIIGSNSVSFLNLLFHFAMGKMLIPSQYGEVAVIISLSGLLNVIPASVNLVVIKYISEAKNDQEREVLISWFKKKVFLASLIFSLIILISTPIFSSFLHIKNLVFLILIAISFFFSIQSLLNRYILQGLLRFKEMVVSMFAENSIKLLFSILLVYFGLQVGGVMVALVISVVLGWYVTSLYLRSYSGQISKKVNLKQISLFTLPVLIQSVALTSIYSSDLILVKHFFSSHDAGLYAALSNISKIILFGAGPIGAVMFPMVSQKYSRGYGYSKIILYSFFATLIFAIFMLIIYWLLPQFIINLLYGISYLEGAPLLIWFGIFIALLTLSSLLIMFHLSLGHTKVVVLPAVTALAQITMIWFYHKNLLSVITVSISVSALLLVLLLIYSSYEKRRSRDQSNISYSAGI